ncbi:MAG: hypothetical protein WCX16_00805 [Candidatus Omnitrophota bacterium]
MEDRIFRYSLIISLVIHILALWKLSYSNLHFKVKTVKKIEVIYPTFALQKKIDPPAVPVQKGMKVDLRQQVKAAQEQKNISSFMKDLSKMKDEFIQQAQKPKIAEHKKHKRRVSVPAVEMREIKNPQYIQYYQVVRSRIKDRAYANYGKFDAGEVYLTFILDAKGSLKRIKVIEERTRANQYLRQISMRSVEESSPFPPFPDELHYPELSFNVVISYEVE